MHVDGAAARSCNGGERAWVDVCECSQGPDVGEIQRIKIRSSNTGLGASWHLSHVDVFSSSSPEMFHFPFNNWWATWRWPSGAF